MKVLGHGGVILKGEVGIQLLLISLSLLSFHEVNVFVPPHAPTMECCLIACPKATGPTNYGLKAQKCKAK